MKTLDRELAHAKVSANRVEVVVANEWKDGNDKEMPVKQWLEERRLLQVSNECLTSSSLTRPFLDGYLEAPQWDCSLFTFSSLTRLNHGTFVNLWRIILLQGEMQQLRDKLAIAERAARSVAQLKVYIILHVSYDVLPVISSRSLHL